MRLYRHCRFCGASFEVSKRSSRQKYCNRECWRLSTTKDPPVSARNLRLALQRYSLEDIGKALGISGSYVGHLTKTLGIKNPRSGPNGQKNFVVRLTARDRAIISRIRESSEYKRGGKYNGSAIRLSEHTVKDIAIMGGIEYPKHRHVAKHIVSKLLEAEILEVANPEDNRSRRRYRLGSKEDAYRDLVDRGNEMRTRSGKVVVLT